MNNFLELYGIKCYNSYEYTHLLGQNKHGGAYYERK